VDHDFKHSLIWGAEEMKKAEDHVDILRAFLLGISVVSVLHFMSNSASFLRETTPQKTSWVSAAILNLVVSIVSTSIPKIHALDLLHGIRKPLVALIRRSPDNERHTVIELEIGEVVLNPTHHVL
jgi:hypothetical protein